MDTRSPRSLSPFRAAIIFSFVLCAYSIGWLSLTRPPYAPHELRAFYRLLHFNDLPALWVMAGAMLAALALLPLWREEAVQRLLLFIDHAIKPIALGCFLVYGSLAFFVIHRHPLSMDEYCILFQSKVFAAGRLAGEVPADLIDWVVVPLYQSHFLRVNHLSGAIVSPYWPGFSLLLTPFTAAGVAWLFNPLLTAVSIYCLHGLAKRLSGSVETASWTTLFALASPVLALNAGTYYTMPAHLLANIVFCRLLVEKDRRYAFGAGLVGGFALVLHNPLPHLGFAIPWLIYVARRERKLLAPLFFGYLVFALPLGLGWPLVLRAVTGSDPAGSTSGLLSLLEKSFGAPSSLLVTIRLSSLAKTVAWAAPGLLVLAWLGWRRASEERPLRLLAASLGCSFLAYLFVTYDPGFGWGYRYLHQTWFVLPLLAGAYLARDFLPGGPPTADLGSMRRYFSLAALLGLLSVTPYFVVTAEMLVRGQVEQVPAAPTATRSLLFIAPRWGAAGSAPSAPYYTADLIQNDPFLRPPAWRVVSRDPVSNARLARRLLGGAVRTRSGPWGELWVENAAIGPHSR